MSEPAGLTPIPAAQRNDAIDVVRGVAILGIFMVNILFFSLPLVDFMMPPAPGTLTGADFACWALVKVFFEFKFISIFSLLFGAGMVVQMQRAEAKGRPFAPVYLRRLATLALIGLAHGFLLWYGDILFLYACVGLLVFFARNLKPRTMILVAAIAFAAGIGIPGLFGLLGAAKTMMQPGGAAAHAAPETAPAPAAAVEAGAGDGGPAGEDGLEAGESGADDGEGGADDESGADEGESGADDGEGGADDESGADEGESGADDGGDDRWTKWVDALKAVAEEPEDIARWREVELLAYRDGPLAAALIVRGATFVTINVSLAFGGLWFRTAALFLLGATLMKLGFFERSMRRWHWWLCLAGLPGGLGLEVLAAWLHLQVGAGRPAAMAFLDIVHQVGSVVLALGYIGTIMLAAGSAGAGALLRPVAAVGRTALSCYLLQTVIATAIMYWWGLGRFGSFSRAELVGVVMIVWAGLMVASMLWLSFFRMGPAEWAWRSLTYWRRQPLLR